MQDIISRGQDMSTVKGILERHDVLGQMKASLMEQEDLLVRDPTVHPDTLAHQQRHIAMMRIAITDLMDTIEGYILEGENAQHEADN